MPEPLALFGGNPIRRAPFKSWPVFGRAEEKRLLDTLRSGKWGRLDGTQVAEFEARFAKAHGCRYGIAVANGTVSLRIALMAAGIQAGDEVIVPPYSFFSTASAVVEVNAVPVFADIDLSTFNLAPESVRAALTRRTRAVIPVHFAGQPADMGGLLAVARPHKLTVIEDAAHAHGATYKGRPAGSIGHLGSFSFQSSKNMTSGEGGIITTNDRRLAELCRSIHNCGRIPKGIWYEHHMISGNYRLSEFQGAILNSQLDRLEAQVETRDRNGRYLAGKLEGLPGIDPQRRSKECTRHAYHLFMLRFDEEEFGAPRSAMLEALAAEGIPCAPGYGRSLHRQPIFTNQAFGPFLPKTPRARSIAKSRCPNSDRICQQAIWLEQSAFLGTRSDMDDIAKAFDKVWQNRAELRERFGRRVGGKART